MVSAVRLHGVWKEYPYYAHMHAGLKSFIFNLPKSLSSMRQGKFTALTDISLEVVPGETFGFIGRNGSGKSTILGLIAGVIKQDKGLLEVKGKVSSLLELGAGFHPDLSGVENVVLNGILMGNTKEAMLAKMDEIVDFSELGDFIHQPLRTYSSGMQVRLGFSVAVHIDPDVLLVDEALSVGDVGFQEKCVEKMVAFRESGATIIMVSHDMTAIEKLCDRAAWIDGGKLMAIGSPNEVIGRYEEFVTAERHVVLSGHIKAGDDEKAAEAKTSSVGIGQEEPTAALSGRDDTDQRGAAVAAGRAVSWWDSPLVLRESERVITGSDRLTFQAFLKERYGIKALSIGLSICNKLQGLEEEFVASNICSAFDTVTDPGRLSRIFAGDLELPHSRYEMILCVDVLGRIKDLSRFMPQVAAALADDGFLIAVEYIGPQGFVSSEKERRIASDLSGIFRADGVTDLATGGIAGDAPAGGGKVVPAVGDSLRIVAVRDFGGPLYDLLLNGLVTAPGFDERRDEALLKTLVRCERTLVEEGALRSNYAAIIARKEDGLSR